MINWNSLIGGNKVGNAFIEFCAETGLCQRVLEPTTIKGSLLDLLFCDEMSFRNISFITVLPPLCSTCDHHMISFQIDIQKLSDSGENIPSFYRYSSGDYTSINKELSEINWKNIFTRYDLDIQKIYDHYLSVMHSLMKKYIPMSMFRKKIRQPKHILKMAKQKKVLHKKTQI